MEFKSNAFHLTILAFECCPFFLRFHSSQSISFFFMFLGQMIVTTKVWSLVCVYLNLNRPQTVHSSVRLSTSCQLTAPNPYANLKDCKPWCFCVQETCLAWLFNQCLGFRLVFQCLHYQIVLLLCVPFLCVRLEQSERYFCCKIFINERFNYCANLRVCVDKLLNG